MAMTADKKTAPRRAQEKLLDRRQAYNKLDPNWQPLSDVAARIMARAIGCWLDSAPPTVPSAEIAERLPKRNPLSCR